MKRLFIIVLGLSLGAVGCGDSNWFKFSHKAGSSSDVESLSADADIALLNKDFGAALNFYEQILSKDPGRSEALYGASSAWLGAAGFDVASIITNILSNQDKLSSPVLSGVISKAAGVSKHATGDLLPSNMDWKALRVATGKAVEYLRRIVSGNTDGVIPPNNTNVRVNLIICLVLHYAIKVVDLDGDGDIENDNDDPITIKNDYSISVTPKKVDSVEKCDKAIDILTVFRGTIIDEIVENFDVLMAAYQIDTGDTIGELKRDLISDDEGSFKNEIDDMIAELNVIREGL